MHQQKFIIKPIREYLGGADIAVVKLKTPVMRFTEKIRPACLPSMSGKDCYQQLLDYSPGLLLIVTE